MPKVSMSVEVSCEMVVCVYVNGLVGKNNADVTGGAGGALCGGLCGGGIGEHQSLQGVSAKGGWGTLLCRRSGCFTQVTAGHFRDYYWSPPN